MIQDLASPTDYMSAAQAAENSGDRERAKALLDLAVARFPGDTAALHDRCRLAERMGDWPAAERDWRSFTSAHPDAWWAHAALATAILSQHRREEAEAVVATALGSFASEPALHIHFARMAESVEDWSEARRRWMGVRTRFPRLADAYVGEALVESKLGCRDEAERLLVEAVTNIPDAPEPHLHLAMMAGWRSDWEAAEAWWRGHLQRHPQAWWAHIGILESLGARGLDEAIAVRLPGALACGGDDPVFCSKLAMVLLRYRSERFSDTLTQLEARVATITSEPGSPSEAWHAYALFARDRGDYIGFRNRMEQANALFPDHYVLRVDLAAAREIIAFEHDGDRDPSREIAVQTDSNLMMRFESLGGSMGGCGFGLMQRQHGAEPLGLLRWATIEPDDLVRALEAGFAGLGEPGQTVMRHQGHYDWGATDLVYGVKMDHTHLDRNKVSEAQAVKIVERNFKFLSRKLLSDLETAEKTFVYWFSDRVMRLAQAKAIWHAMRRHGPASLLVLSNTKFGLADYDVLMLDDGLWIGAVPPLTAGFDKVDWLPMLRKAHRLMDHRPDDFAHNNAVLLSRFAELLARSGDHAGAAEVEQKTRGPTAHRPYQARQYLA